MTSLSLDIRQKWAGCSVYPFLAPLQMALALGSHDSDFVKTEHASTVLFTWVAYGNSHEGSLE